MRIRSVDAGYGGAAHDSAVWSVSSERNFLKHCYDSGDTNTWLLGKYILLYNMIHII